MDPKSFEMTIKYHTGPEITKIDSPQGALGLHKMFFHTTFAASPCFLDKVMFW